MVHEKTTPNRNEFIPIRMLVFMDEAEKVTNFVKQRVFGEACFSQVNILQFPCVANRRRASETGNGLF